MKRSPLNRRSRIEPAELPPGDGGLMLLSAKRQPHGAGWGKNAFMARHGGHGQVTPT